MTDSKEVTRHVQVWYAQEHRWMSQGKQPEWPDRVLCDQGELLMGADVLNLGCFFPEDEEALAELARSWTAIDFVPEVIERCKRYQNWSAHIKFEVADMRELPYADAMFDVVTDFSSGDHLLHEDWLKTIKEAHRVLRPGGHFLVCFANRAAFHKILWMQDWVDHPAQLGEYGYTRTDSIESMQKMLEDGGFTLVKRSHDNDGQLRTGMLMRKPV